MKTIDAMKQALEALENHSGNYKLSATECNTHCAAVNDLRGAVDRLQSDAQQVAVPQAYGELIRVAAWLLSPEPTRAIDALEEYIHTGHRQFSAAQEAMREVLRLKAIAIKEAADKLAAAPQPPQAERVPMAESDMPEGKTLIDTDTFCVLLEMALKYKELSKSKNPVPPNTRGAV